MTWHVKSIPVEGLADVWPIVAPLLAPAVIRSGGRNDMRSVFRQIRESYLILWVAREDDKVVRAAFTTRVAEYPLKRMLVIDCAGGEGMLEWLDEVTSTFKRFAADSDLDGVEMYGRTGWVRMLEQRGWNHTMVVCETAAGE